MKKSKRRPAGSTPKALAVPEEMKRWAALLGGEVASWPQVTQRKMFGMTSFYRKRTIFAAIPDKKAFFTPTSLIFKLQSPTTRQQKELAADTRVNASFGIGQKWYGFELHSDEDVHGALEWLGEAFEATKKKATA